MTALYRIGIENEFLRIECEFSQTLGASYLPLIDAGYFVFSALTVGMCTYSMVLKHKTGLLFGRSEVCSKSTFSSIKHQYAAVFDQSLVLVGPLRDKKKIVNEYD